MSKISMVLNAEDIGKYSGPEKVHPYQMEMKIIPPFQNSILLFEGRKLGPEYYNIPNGEINPIVNLPVV